MEYIGMDVHDRYCQVAVSVENLTDDGNTTVSHTKADVELFEVTIPIATVSFGDGETVVFGVLLVLSVDGSIESLDSAGVGR